MLTAEENARLTQVGRSIQIGELLRSDQFGSADLAPWTAFRLTHRVS